MPRVLRTSQANHDLIEIWTYVANDSPVSADRLIDSIADVCGTLADSPAIGRSRDELAQGLRSFPVGRYVVFYRPVSNGIEVIRVLHGARDIQVIFEAEGNRS